MSLSIGTVKTSMFSVLKNDSTLTARITGVFDFVPNNTAFPYVTIGDNDLEESKLNTFGRKGKELNIYIHIFSAYNGDKEALEIANIIDGLLDWATLTLTSHTHIVTSFEGVRIYTEEADPNINKIRHAILRYRVITQEG